VIFVRLSRIIPDELLQQAQGHEVHLNMEDHGQEEFHVVKPKMKVFSGKGNVLGRYLHKRLINNSLQ